MSVIFVAVLLAERAVVGFALGEPGTDARTVEEVMAAVKPSCIFPEKKQFMADSTLLVSSGDRVLRCAVGQDHFGLEIPALLRHVELFVLFYHYLVW